MVAQMSEKKSFSGVSIVRPTSDFMRTLACCRSRVNVLKTQFQDVEMEGKGLLMVFAASKLGK